MTCMERAPKADMRSTTPPFLSSPMYESTESRAYFGGDEGCSGDRGATFLCLSVSLCGCVLASCFLVLVRTSGSHTTPQPLPPTYPFLRHPPPYILPSTPPTHPPPFVFFTFPVHNRSCRSPACTLSSSVRGLQRSGRRRRRTPRTPSLKHSAPHA